MPKYDKVFSTDPDAILEISWGPTIKKFKKNKIKFANQPSVMSNQPSSISNQPSSISNQPSSMSNPPSSMSNPPSSMSNPPSSMSRAETSTNFSFNNTNVYSDDDDDDDDMDSMNDEPLPMTSWGSQQMPQMQQPTLGSNNKNNQDWNSLVDPNFTVKPGGIGSGQLHRKGGNYIPVPEMAIVNQRLKKPIPSSQNSLKMLESDGTIKKKKKRRNRKKRERVQSMPVFAIPERTVNGWGSGQLTSTPFWEQQQQQQQQQQQMEYNQNYQQEEEQFNHPIVNEKDIEILPLLKIEIELAPGVTIPMTIIKGATMMSLVSDICSHHRLSMTQEAMESLCTTLDLLIQAKYP